MSIGRVSVWLDLYVVYAHGSLILGLLPSWQHNSQVRGATGTVLRWDGAWQPGRPVLRGQARW